MKQKLKQEVTIFFALTDQEDFILTVANATGAVWVEQVGKVPHKKLADSLKSICDKLYFSSYQKVFWAHCETAGAPDKQLTCV